MVEVKVLSEFTKKKKLLEMYYSYIIRDNGNLD